MFHLKEEEIQPNVEIPYLQISTCKHVVKIVGPLEEKKYLFQKLSYIDKSKLNNPEIKFQKLKHV